jgi:uncharacterized protein (TIGR03032 family)
LLENIQESEIQESEELKAENSDDIRQERAEYSVSGGFVGLMRQLNLSVSFTSYQSGKLYILGKNSDGGLNVNERLFKKAMGIYADKERLILASLYQIHRFENMLNSNELVNGVHDVCYIPRASYITGAVDAHDVGLLKNGEIVFVNTKYNCLAKISVKKSFVPIWKPQFISKIVGEDRCHLNGMAIENGFPSYVTAISRSDTIDGWRDRRADSGIVINVKDNEIICQGLSMPHSPRVANDKLWVLNSGCGELGFVDKNSGKFEVVTFCPGFVRGLAIYGKYAFVGLSKPRHQRFVGLELDKKLKHADSDAWCGVQVIDIQTGACVEWFRIDGCITEIYDVAVIPKTTCPISVGFLSSDILDLITPDNMESILDF